MTKNPFTNLTIFYICSLVFYLYLNCVLFYLLVQLMVIWLCIFTIFVCYIKYLFAMLNRCL